MAVDAFAVASAVAVASGTRSALTTEEVTNCAPYQLPSLPENTERTFAPTPPTAAEVAAATATATATPPVCPAPRLLNPNTLAPIPTSLGGAVASAALATATTLTV